MKKTLGDLQPKKRTTKNRVVLAGFPGPMSVEQEPFHNPASDINVFACGSKAGKTFNLTSFICRKMWETPIYSTWTAPYRNQTDHSFRIACKLFPPRYTYINRSDMRIELKTNGSVLKYMPTCDPMAIEGAGNDYIIIDEASKAQEEVYDSALTTVSRTNGKVICATTPLGQDNWVYKLYLKGLNPDQNTVSVWNFPTFINPTVDFDKIMKQAHDMTREMFKQYILGEFLPGAGAKVFRKVGKAFEYPTWGWQNVENGGHYVMGCDLARLNDYSVINVLKMQPDSTLVQVDFLRMPHEDWSIQMERIKIMSEKYNRCPVVIDSTGPGQPLAEDLRRLGINVEEFTFNNQRKNMLIQRGQIEFEREGIKLADLPEVKKTLGIELNELQMTLTRSGLIGFEAPRGQFDDSVMSLCLAIFYARNIGMSGRSLRDMGLGPANNPRVGGTRKFKSRRQSITKQTLW